MKKIFIIILYILILSSKSYSNDKFEGKWINKETSSVYEIIKKDYSAFILSKDWLDYYRLFIGCEERGYGNYHAFISLNHEDLSMLDYLEKTALPKTKKKF